MILHDYDHPGMVLMLAPLTGNNYLSWSRLVQMALRAKTKLSFINGTSTPPGIDSPHFSNWKKADCMVLSWLLNSISKDILESFIYESCSWDLWLEIESRFKESSGPMIYHIQRQINPTTQGNLTITQYYLKLKRF